MTMSTTRRPGRGDARPGLGERLEEALRGLWAVIVLVLTGVDALVTAVIGIRPLTPVLSRIGHVIADEYRAGANEWIDADVVDHDPEGVRP